MAVQHVRQGGGRIQRRAIQTREGVAAHQPGLIGGTAAQHVSDEHARSLRRSGADTDTELMHDVIEVNVDDTSFWLRKAIGWALREYARTDSDWVRAEVDRLGPEEEEQA